MTTRNHLRTIHGRKVQSSPIILQELKENVCFTINWLICKHIIARANSGSLLNKSNELI